MEEGVEGQGELTEFEQTQQAAASKSLLLSISGENHTLGNALRDIMWSHPHITLASYTKDHPSSTEVLVRCQTSGAISAEQGVVEALGIAKEMLGAVGSAMDTAVEQWVQQGGTLGSRGGSQDAAGGAASKRASDAAMEDAEVL